MVLPPADPLVDMEKAHEGWYGLIFGIEDWQGCGRVGVRSEEARVAVTEAAVELSVVGGDGGKVRFGGVGGDDGG